MAKFLLLALLIFLSASLVFAQPNENEVAEKYGITFPIKELGDCGNIEACTNYCDDISNFAACHDFAIEKGLYSQEDAQDELSEDEQRLLLAAPDELGCQTISSCEEFCTDTQNFEKCYNFALKHGLTEPKTTYTNQEEVEIIEEAREELGCDSEDSCWAFCEREENFKMCEEFAEKVEDLKFVVDETAYEPIEVWCPKSNPGWECTIEEDTCVCTEPGDLWCPSAGPDCKWTGIDCICGPEFEEEPPEVWCPKAGEYCKWLGGYCDCSEPGEVWCPKEPGCNWTGDECLCERTGEVLEPSTSEESPEVPIEEPGEVWCPEQGPDCRWMGDYCDCPASPAVEGVSAQGGLLQILLNYIQSLIVK